MRPREASDEDFFQFRLDADTNDHGARLLLAEWLAECGADNAAGFFWMAWHCKAPDHDSTRSGDDRTWDWWSSRGALRGQSDERMEFSDRIAPVLMDALDGYLKKSRWDGDRAYCEYRTRIQAEEGLIRALMRHGSIDATDGSSPTAR